MEKRIYLDHAATTYTKQEVLEEMLPFFTEQYGNPSSVHAFGREARKALDLARERTAKALNADPGSIYFTGSGTEADNWAIKGAAFANQKKGNHIITTSIEHHAVLHTCQYLERNGFEVTYLPVDKYGLLDPEQVRNAIRDDTILISVMSANNEIGTIQPIKAIGEVTRKHGVLFHCDAVQAAGSIPIDVKDLGVDLLSISGHKFYGPKGIGALYIRKGVRLENLIHGGHQERGKRPGTENIPGIIGMAKALELAVVDMEQYTGKIKRLRDKAMNLIMERIPHVKLNGPVERRLPGNLNISFRFIEGESLLLMLDMKGIKASSGSACSSGSLDPSHVLMAIGLSHEIAHGSLRMSFGEHNTEDEVDYLVDSLEEIVARLRTMSPLYEDFIKENK